MKKNPGMVFPAGENCLKFIGGEAEDFSYVV